MEPKLNRASTPTNPTTGMFRGCTAEFHILMISQLARGVQIISDTIILSDTATETENREVLSTLGTHIREHALRLEELYQKQAGR